MSAYKNIKMDVQSSPHNSNFDNSNYFLFAQSVHEYCILEFEEDTQNILSEICFYSPETPVIKTRLYYDDN